jgi:hypothetical protein
VCQTLQGGVQSVLGQRRLKLGLGLFIGHLGRGAHGRVRLAISTRGGTGVVHGAVIAVYRGRGRGLKLAARSRKPVTLTRKPHLLALPIHGGARLAAGRYYVRIVGTPDSQKTLARTRAKRHVR